MAYTFPAGNVVWTPRDITALLCTKMSPNDNRPIVGCAVVLAESGGDPLATGRAVWNPSAPTHLSIDLGLFQLNSYYHTVTGPYPDIPAITVAQCFDPFASFDQTWKVINKVRPDGWHYNWSPWNVYKTGAYDKYMEVARQALIDYKLTIS